MDSTLKFCGECGGKLSEGARFCGECGTPMSGFQNKQQETSGSSPGTTQNESKPVFQKETESNSDYIKSLVLIFIILLLVPILGGFGLFNLIGPIILFIIFVWAIGKVSRAAIKAAKAKYSAPKDI